MNRTPSLYVYRLILRSHPQSFIDRFGDEMLWIFKEECQRGATVRLLLDAMLSLLRQHLSTQDEPIHGPIGSALLISDQRISAVRLIQGALIASLLLLGFFSSLARSSFPLPVPFELQQRECASCSSSPQTPPETGTPRDILQQPVK